MKGISKGINPSIRHESNILKKRKYKRRNEKEKRERNEDRKKAILANLCVNEKNADVPSQSLRISVYSDLVKMNKFFGNALENINKYLTSCSKDSSSDTD